MRLQYKYCNNKMTELQQGEQMEAKREFPKKKANPRNAVIRIAITERQKEAFRRESKETGKGESALGYEMLMRGSLSTLEARHFADDATNISQ